MESKDDRPTLGNQAGIHRGVIEEHSDRNNQWISQPGCSMEHGDPSTRSHQSTSCDGTLNILPNRQQTNGPISHGARVRVVFKELGDEEQKDLLVELAQDFT